MAEKFKKNKKIFGKVMKTHLEYSSPMSSHASSLSVGLIVLASWRYFWMKFRVRSRSFLPVLGFSMASCLSQMEVSLSAGSSGPLDMVPNS